MQVACFLPEHGANAQFWTRQLFRAAQSYGGRRGRLAWPGASAASGRGCRENCEPSRHEPSCPKDSKVGLVVRGAGNRPFRVHNPYSCPNFQVATPMTET
jgi:hypothetical protein